MSLAGTPASSKMFNFVLISCLTTILLGACTAPGSNVRQAQVIREQLVESFPESQPKWYLQVPETDRKYYYFAGHSAKHLTETEARNKAMANATNRFIRFCGVKVNIFNEYQKTTTGKASSVLDASINTRELSNHTAQAFVTSVKGYKWYVRRYKISFSDNSSISNWKSSVLIRVPIEERKRIEEYAEKRANILKAAGCRNPGKESKRDGTYIEYTNGVVWDTDTGFTWYAGPDTDTDWKEAESWAKNLNVGKLKWRMPNISELRTLYKKKLSPRNHTQFLKTTGWWVWSSEIKDVSSALYFDFGSGKVDWRNRNHTYSTRGFAICSQE